MSCQYMPRRYSTREVAEALKRIGIRFLRQKGSLMRYSIWRGRERNVTLVAGQQLIPPRTLSQILSQIGVRPEEFVRLIEGAEID